MKERALAVAGVFLIAAACASPGEETVDAGAPPSEAVQPAATDTPTVAPQQSNPPGPSVEGMEPPATVSQPAVPVPDTAPVTPAMAAQEGDADREDAAGERGAEILRRAADAYEHIRSLRADFTMVQNNPLLRSTTTSHGTLFQRRPDRILLRFSDPKGDVIVGDGTYFWVYYPSIDPKQVIRTTAPSAGPGAMDLQAQFVGDPVERFEYTLDGRESVDGRPADVLTLVPHEDPGYEKLKVWIDVKDSLVRRFEITEQNGSVRHFDLSGLTVNPTLSDDLFRFTPPPGAQVVTR